MSDEFKQYLVPEPEFDGYNEDVAVQQALGSDRQSSIMEAGDYKSANFVEGSSGWRLEANGDLEANDGNFRGDITGASGTFSGAVQASAINIPDTTTSDSFHVNTEGDTWWGATVADFNSNNDNAIAYILKNGIAKLQALIVVGGSIDATTTINGSTAGNVQSRAEALFNNLGFLGNASDGLTETAGGGSITREAMGSYLDSATGSDCSLQTNVFSAPSSNFPLTWADNYEVSIIIATEKNVTQDVFIGLAGFSSTPANATSTTRHAGFMIQDGTLYASNANGSAQNRTDISSGITITSFNRYQIVFVSGSSVRFYVNDVLKATHTLQVPSSGDVRLFMGITCQSGGSNQSLRVGNNYLVLSSVG